MNANTKKEDNKMTDSMTEIFGDVIYAYTAKQAEEDGYLVNVTEWAREAGFAKPFEVRITRSVYNLCTPPKSNKIQSLRGRAHDVLFLAMIAIKRAGSDENRAYYKCKIGRKNETLIAALDTTSGPAIHIMLPGDD